jgi:hypothetical protein
MEDVMESGVSSGTGTAGSTRSSTRSTAQVAPTGLKFFDDEFRRIQVRMQARLSGAEVST